jgi:Tol biopolymer transport system component
MASAAALAAILVGFGAWALRPATTAPVVARFSTTLPDGLAFGGTSRQTLAISPDGAWLTYIADRRLYLRSLGEFDAHEVPGINPTSLGLVQPIFSPDGQSIAYFSFGEVGSNIGASLLKRIPIRGGAATTLATIENPPFGASWGPNGILIGQGRAGVFHVPATGGMPTRIVEVGRDEFAHGPQMLPDGRTVLFTLATAIDRDDRWDEASIVAQSLDDGTRRVLVKGGSDARFLPTGHLAYAVSGTLFAVPFDVGRLLVSGAPVPVVVGVRRAAGGQTGAAHLSVSDTGTLAYVTGAATQSSAARGLVVGDGRNDPLPLNAPPANYVHPRVSPNGRTLAVGRTDGDASDIWTLDLSGASEMRRLTFGGQSRYPVWSADSRRVTFQSSRDSANGILWQAADGSGTAEQLTKAAEGEEHRPEAWSRDGARLLFSVLKTDGVHTLSMFTLAARSTEPVARVGSAEPLSATFSPDGRWIAYASTDRAGGTISPDRGVFVEPVPPTGERHQAPKTQLDYHPVWTPDGRSILYVPASPRPIVSVPVTTQPSVVFGTPTDLTRFPRPGLISTSIRGYDVLPDGGIVSLNPAPGDAAAAAAAVNEIRIVVNWFEELKRLAPSDGR